MAFAQHPAQKSANDTASIKPYGQSNDMKDVKTVISGSPQKATDPRQAQLIANTETLLKLTQQLKEDVARSNKDTLSLELIKKSEEVQKQARVLKEALNKYH